MCKTVRPQADSDDNDNNIFEPETTDIVNPTDNSTTDDQTTTFSTSSYNKPHYEAMLQTSH
eukprot:6788571-Ditylum_brightwellii.AAC.1